jgi:hypothetical protein
MGCGQVARQGNLDPSFGGSNPPTPAKVKELFIFLKKYIKIKSFLPQPILLSWIF